MLAYDVKERKLNSSGWCSYADLPEFCNQGDIMSIHTPFTKQTRHMIYESLIKKMKRGVMIFKRPGEEWLRFKMTLLIWTAGITVIIVGKFMEEKEGFSFLSF